MNMWCSVHRAYKKWGSALDMVAAHYIIMQLSILSPMGFELEVFPEGWGIWPAICTKHQIL